MKPTTQIVEQAEVSEQQLIDAATNAIAAEFWTVGWAASEWVKLGKSEQEFADKTGLSRQSVNQKRRVHERFKEVANRLANLSFTHFIRALDMKEPEEWLEEANDNKWSWREMIANHDNHYTPADEESEQESTPAQNAVYGFFDGDSDNDETVEASGDPQTPSDCSSDSATGPEQTTPPASPSIVQDKLGHDIPSSLRDAFESIVRLNKTAKFIDKQKREYLSMCEQPGCEFINPQDVEALCKSLKDLFVGARYYATCPHCHGDGCKECRGHGYYPEKYKNHLQTEVVK